MDKEYFDILAKVRLERAEELLEESQSLLSAGSFKSANNRAFYAIEKCIKALLATKEIDAATHNGALKQFNFLFIYKGDGSFCADDYQIIAKAEQIRNASDYDDFYIASKEESRQQVENAAYFLKKVKEYLSMVVKENDLQNEKK
ncbi:MAG: HEPN domain-containing protein [Lachnospiraceae bacterium]|nr:HEPN domain-containing protein [Lachnospiraceae bacterium]